MRSSHHITNFVLSNSIVFQNAVDAAVFPSGKGPRLARTSGATESSPGSARPCSSTADWVVSMPRAKRSVY